MSVERYAIPLKFEIFLFQNDGSKLAAGCKNGLVVVWNRSGQKLMECHQHHSLVTCLRWNKKPGGTDTLFVTGDSKGVI